MTIKTPLSKSVRRGSIVAVSGQVGFDPTTGELVSSDVAVQTVQALRNVEQALAECGASLSDVIRVGVFLTDAEHFAELNRVYREFFSDPYPARTTVFVRLLDGIKVEIDALAILSE